MEETRKDPEDAAVNSGNSGQSTVTPPMDGGCDDNTIFRVKRSLRRRNGIDYSIIDYSSEEELDHDKLFQGFEELMIFDFDTRRSKHSRKANDVRGRLPNLEFEEVTARWAPEGACRPFIEEAPVFYPTEEDFKDTLGYISRIRHEGEKYGICRIIPPPSWNPSCPLREKSIWELAQFSTRVQQIDKLQNREPMRKRSRNRFQRKRKRRKRIRFGMSRRRDNNNAIDVNDCSSDTDEKFGFQPGSDFTLQSFQMYAENFKEQYFGMQDGMGDKFLCDDETFKRWKPSVEVIEGEYWRIVEKPTNEVEVFYGADLETGIFGSGFPREKSTIAKDMDPHVYSGWNLNNFPRLPGSLLSFEDGDISGVLVPWLYIAMCFSSFCWHVEDHHLYSLNYLHWGDPKIWYGVPGSAAVKLEDAMRKHLPELFEEQPDLLHELVTQLSPSVLKSEGVPVYRAVQNAGEFVLTFPRAYHSGFSCGFNCAEAVNVAPMDWLPHGQCAVELYSEQHRKTSISHDKLLMGAAREAIRAQWELLFGLKNSHNLSIQGFCGKDGMLTMAMRARVEMERVRRETYCRPSQARKMDRDFDSSNERECFYCFYDLHLSAMGCECSSNRHACLTHAGQLCTCEPSRRFFLFRYSMDELNTMIEALEGCSSAVQQWGSFDMGLVLPSKVTENIDQKNLNPICEPDQRVFFEKTIPAVDRNISGRSCTMNVVGLSSQNPETSFVTNIKEELDSGNINGINHGSASRQRHELMCSQITLEENNRCELDPGSSLDVYQGELSKDSKVRIHDLPERACGFNEGNKKEQDFTVGVMQELTTGGWLEGKDMKKCESIITSNTPLWPNPLGGSVGLSPSCSSDTRCTNQFSTKLFGIHLKQHQSLLPSSGEIKSGIPGIKKHFVEPLQLGVALFGKHWCNAKAIFPKGFRSRVRYFSVLNPVQTCRYISEVVDAGLIGPLFKVSLEGSPEETFLHSSPAACWDLVRQRLNQEIKRQGGVGSQDLPPLQPPGSIDGLEMFGFLSPSIVEMVESLDPCRRCSEYWASKPNKRAPNSAKKPPPGFGSTIPSVQDNVYSERSDPSADDEVYHLLRPLFRKASLEELLVLHRIFRSGSDSSCWRAAHRALLNEVEKNVQK
ncbi:hypothetical protein HPP92_001877 [Vanilla planifolia]|uniref:Uncharacterized protein n=1 Tax=Vanilla planifolia TaxID=51239 RepID=A0A835VHY4_VANPL|nr:hypothetical protein HPP92_001877 [Vanilla planifolia]